MINQTKKQQHYCDTLCLLYEIIAKFRRSGLASVEQDICNPDADTSIFVRYPVLRENPRHLELMLDMLRLMTDGNLNAEELRYVFQDIAKRTFINDGGQDEALWDSIFVTLYASICGYAPQVAVEFGRQAVPYSSRPSFIELETKCKELRDAAYAKRQGEIDPLCVGAKHSLEDRVDQLFAQMKAK